GALGEREHGLGGARDAAARGDAAPVLLARGSLQLGEALEAEGLREADDGGARRVRAPGELLGGLEGDLVEVVDDVLRDVLLRTRELVEARLDVGREGLVAARLVGRRGRGRRGPLHGQNGYSTRRGALPSPNCTRPAGPAGRAAGLSPFRSAGPVLR